MPNRDLSLIVAMTQGARVIGKRNALPWQLPSDLARFKRITTEAGIIIMGRHTFDSIVKKNGAPLPGRQHIVLTSRPMSRMESVLPAASVGEALMIVESSGKSACVIGGAQIYTLFLPLIQRAYITTVYASLKGDTFFPMLNRSLWRPRDVSEIRKWHPNDEYPTSFSVLERVPARG